MGRRGPKPKAAEERFWSHVDKSGECWEWIAYRNNSRGGYGRFQPAVGIRKEAHRYAWEITHGPIPDGLYVCHDCDNPSCVRPDHLFLGTQKDNIRDASRKGRMVGNRIRGPRPKTFSPTPVQIRRMMDLRELGHTHDAIGSMLGFSQSTVSRRLKEVSSASRIG